jgi:hypothetical protein
MTLAVQATDCRTGRIASCAKHSGPLSIVNSGELRPALALRKCNRKMRTIAEVRRLRLLELKDKWRTWPAMNDKLGYTARDSTLSQIASQSIGSRNDKPKEMGSDLARKLEETFGKPSGWMDTDPDEFWPFSVISVSRWRALDERRKGMVEQAALEALTKLEAGPSGEPAPQGASVARRKRA